MMRDERPQIHSAASFQENPDSLLDREISANGGRPRLPEKERRTHRYTVSVNAREREVIEEFAKAAGLTPAVYLREAGRRAHLGRKANRQAIYQLSRIGVHLHKLAREAERDRRMPEHEALEELLQTVRRAIHEL